MRTVIFFGLMAIADSIGYKTGWTATASTTVVGATIFVVAMIFDVVDWFRGSKS